MKPQKPESLSWEIYHENSKSSFPIIIRNADLSYGFSGVPTSFSPIFLPEIRQLDMHFSDVALQRRSCYSWSGDPSDMRTLGTILHYGYGKSSRSDDQSFRRYSPSAGALYPLELYVYPYRISGISNEEVHYYNSFDHSLSAVRPATPEEFFNLFFQPEFLLQCSFLVVICGVPSRLTGKYGERGYRYALFEAGHVAQTMCLAASACSLGSLCLGGFFDHQIDSFLNIDGLNSSVLYACGFGLPLEKPR